MSFEEKFDSAKDKVVGKAKEFEGKITGDKSREAEGKAQGFVGKAKEVVSDVKDAVKDAVEDFKEDNKK